MTVLQRLAQFVARTPAARIPEAGLERAKLALIDLIGASIAGSAEPVSNIVARHVARTSRGGATLIVGGSRASAADAALANATAGHALDFDDSNFVLGGHPSVTLLPALLAVGEERGCTGRDILEAYVIGFEVMMKLSRAVNFEHYEKGWHPTATMGVFGATAAVARLMRLSTQQVQHALALAASMASGVKANFGAMAKPFQVGHASQKGVLCAQFAADGLTASAAALDGRQGFLDVYNGAGNYRAGELTAIGERLDIFQSGLMFKKYPCCGATHAPIDAALDMVRTHAIRSEDIASATIAVNQRRLTHVNRPKVTTALEAKFSIHYTVAAALCDGAIGLRHFSKAALSRADVQNLLARVRAEGIEGAESLSQACVLTVQLKDGTMREVRRDDADGRGVEEYPRYMQAKFNDCVEQVFDRARAEELYAQLRAFQHCTDIGACMSRMHS